MSRGRAHDQHIIVKGVPEVEPVASIESQVAHPRNHDHLRHKLENVTFTSPRNGIYDQLKSKLQNGAYSSSHNGMHQFNAYASALDQRHNNGTISTQRSGCGPYICGAQQYEVGGTSGSGVSAARYSSNNQGNNGHRGVLLRGATQYASSNLENVAQKSPGTFVTLGFGEESLLDDDIGVLEDVLQARFLDLSVMSFNLNYFSSWPKDPDVAYRQLVSIIEVQPPPDLICVQEGLCGRDVFHELGYHLVQSSRSSSHTTLSQALYNDKDILKDVEDGSRERYLVNEVYIRGDGSKKMNWEIVGSGSEQISSGEALIARSVVWVQLRHVARLDGPFVYVFNTQLSGGPIEERLFSPSVIARERCQQVERALNTMHEKAGPRDLIIFSGELGIHDEENEQFGESSHFALLAARGWKFIYGQAQVGPTSSLGHLVDHMATNRATPAQVKVFATTNQASELPVTHTPLSDHNAVKATFSIRFEATEADRRSNVSPDAQHFFIGDADQQIQQIIASEKIVEEFAFSAKKEDEIDTFKRRMFPLTVRPDPRDTSYVAECARAQCDYQDLVSETAMEQQAMDDMTTDLSGKMLELRKECSEQIRGNNNISQLMQNAHAVITAINDDWVIKCNNLHDELKDAEVRTQTSEMEVNAEIYDVKSRIFEAEQQLEDMDAGRDALSRHLDSIDESIDGFRKDIEEEKKMTREIKEVGDKNWRERSEKYAKDAEHLQQELKVIDDELQRILAGSEVEFARLEGELKEKDLQLAETDACAEREFSEFKARCETWKVECAEKQGEFASNEAKIASQLEEVREFEANRHFFEETMKLSHERHEQLQDESRVAARQIADLEQELVMIRDSTKECERHLQEYKGKSRSKVDKDAANQAAEELQNKLWDLDRRIAAEEQRNQELASELDAAPPRGGLCACFFPRPRLAPRTDAKPLAIEAPRSGSDEWV